MGGVGGGRGCGAFGKFARERALAVAIADDAVRDAWGEGEVLELEDVTGFGALHGDRAEDEVGAVFLEVVRDGGAGDGDCVVEDGAAGHAEAREEGGGVAALVFEHALVAYGVEGDDGARGYGEDGGGAGRGQVAPADGGGDRGHVEGCAGVEGCGRGAGLLCERLQHLGVRCSRCGEHEQSCEVRRSSDDVPAYPGKATVSS